MRGAILIVAGLLIDLLQWAVTFVLIQVALAAGTVGGAAAGAASGSALCGTLCASIGGLIGGAVGTLANAAIAPFSVPVAMVLAFAVNSCITIVFGAGFILLLVIFRMFSPAYVWSAFFGELLPGFNELPTWTVLAVLCVLRNKAKTGKGIGALAATAASAILSPGGALRSVGRQATAGVGAWQGTKAGNGVAGRFLGGSQDVEGSAQIRGVRQELSDIRVKSKKPEQKSAQTLGASLMPAQERREDPAKQHGFAL